MVNRRGTGFAGVLLFVSTTSTTAVVSPELDWSKVMSFLVETLKNANQ